MTIEDLHSEESKAKAAATRKERARMINMRRLVKRRREPGETPSMKCATQNFCRECMGWDAAESGSLAQAIRECSAAECWLYPWRTGKLDVETYEPETLEDLECRVEAGCRERGKTG